MPSILDLDPQTQGILAAAFAGLQASGPSRMPTSLGQIVGDAGQSGMAAFERAKLGEEKKKQLDAELALKEVQTQAAKLGMAKTQADMDLQKQLIPGGILGAGMNDPDVLEAVGMRMAAAGHPGGSGFIAQAEKIRAKKAQDAQLATMRGAPLPESKADEVGISATDAEALQRVKDAAARGKTAAVAVDQGGQGIFGSLINSPVPSIAAQARSSQGILNAQPVTGAAVPPQHWLDIQKGLAGQEATLLSRESNLAPSAHVVKDAASSTGWSYKDLRSGKIVGTDAPPPASAQMGSTAVIPPEHSDLHGQDYLTTLPGGMAELVKSIAEGRVDVSKAASLRYGSREAVMQRVMQYDPTYNAQRPTVWKDFTSGKAANNITAMNTVLAHIGTLDDLTDALKNGNLQTANALVNRVRTELGKPEVNNAEIAVQAVGNELMRVFRQVNASQSEVEAWEKKFAAAKGSPDQIKGAIKVGVDLLKGRLDAVNDQWKRGMGVETDFPNILSPKSQTVLDRVTKSAEPAASAPKGAWTSDKEQRYQELLRKRNGA